MVLDPSNSCNLEQLHDVEGVKINDKRARNREYLEET